MQIAAREILTTQTAEEPASGWWGFWVKALNANSTVKMGKGGTPPSVTLEYSLDEGRSWTSFDPEGGTTVRLVNEGDLVCFRSGVGGNSAFATGTSNYRRFVFTGRVSIGGNIMSLISQSKITEFPILSTQYVLAQMFYFSSVLVSADELLLPAQTLAARCYVGMFQGCSALTAIPELPATTLSQLCYANMFRSCTSLHTVPELKATVMSPNCYQHMFAGCTSLTTPPSLPSETMAAGCYGYMFSGCSNLQASPKLPAKNTSSNCYQYMFQNCPLISSIITEQSSFTGCSNWVSGVAENGTFVCPSSLGSYSTISRGVSACPTNWNVINPEDAHFYVRALTAGSTVKMASNGAPPSVSLEYSIDGGTTWVNFDVDGGTTVTLSAIGDIVRFRAGATENACFASSSTNYRRFVFSGRVAIGGNIMSLLTQTEVAEFPSATLPYTFAYLFLSARALTDASSLILPATRLLSRCYNFMFAGCQSLTAAPRLPATTLAENCYAYMFRDCYSLTTAPTLPATSLSPYCYYLMFENCSALTTAPALPATNLANYCYYGMFWHCSSLTAAPVLSATTLANYCYYGMFSSCYSLTAAPVLPATTLQKNCYNYMFQSCTALTVAPELPANTLAEYCYAGMFKDCTSLTAMPELPSTTLAASCYYMMFDGCTNLISAHELPATTLANACYHYMFERCTSLTVAPMLYATSLALNCCYGMFDNCTSLTTAPELLATTLADHCYDSMFYNCTSLTVAPELHATTLAYSCYAKMFYGCASLQQITTSLTSWNGSGTSQWVSGVASTGTFTCPAALPQTLGTSYIPSYWTIVTT